MRGLHFILLCAVVLLASGCGGDAAGEDDRSPRDATTTSPASTSSEPAADPCAPPARILPAPRPATAAALASATRDLARAVERAGAARRRFVTDGEVVVTGGVRVRARLVGERAADGSSTGRLDWRGAAALVAPDADLRIVDNQLTMRRDDEHAAGFTPMGSASGIALDVGRELLTHPFLLDVVAVGGSGDIRTYRLVARPDDLRAYAGTERQGLATELLVGARSLTIDVRVVDGVLVSDVFRLRTVLPDRFAQRVGGSAVTVVGRTIAGCSPG